MISALERLRTLRVADVMSKQVVTLGVGQSMADAAEVFHEHQISGAPIVDEHGVCVGLLSANDFVHKERAANQQQAGETPGPKHLLVRDVTDGPCRLVEFGGDQIRSYMSPSVQAIAPSAHLLDAARIMCAQHVHRLPVFDDHGRAVGMVTSLDLVAALVHVAQEKAAI